MLKARSFAALAFALAASPLLASIPGGDARQTANEVRQKENGEFLLKHYPPRALEAGEEGQVRFRVTLDEKGEMTSCDVTKSSGFSRLDRETCEIIQRYASFRPVVNSEGRSITATRNGFVNWRLPEGMLRTARPRSAATAGAASEKMICSRGIRTGSLVATDRRCMRQSEWGRMTREAKARTSEVQGSKGAAWDGMDKGP
ncbi:MAG TPA: energy transducer TonB [Allosphingosinicella sp.]|nr:energy transducer TonB [Allosphingosinicella sp.]